VAATPHARVFIFMGNPRRVAASLPLPPGPLPLLPGVPPEPSSGGSSGPDGPKNPSRSGCTSEVG
jgi:hypothetical protein